MTSLLDGTGPDLYRTNAFRVTGLPVGATTRDIRRQSERMRAAERYGVSAAGVDTPVLPLPRPPDESEVREIAQRLRDPAKRLVDELFWFWPDGEDDPAMAALRGGDMESAERAWLARDTPVSRHNVAVLFHARALDAESPDRDLWSAALVRWYDVFSDDAFWDLFDARATELDDPRLTPATARAVRRDLPARLLSINAGLAVRAHREQRRDDAVLHLGVLTSSKFDPDTIGDVRRQAVRTDRDRITDLCDAAERAIDADARTADEAGAGLLDRTAGPLGTLRTLLAEDDLARRGAEDRVAHQVMRCAITYGNRTGDWPTARELLTASRDLAAGESTRADIARNLTIAEDNVRGATCVFCPRPADGSRPLVRMMYGRVERGQVRVTWQTGEIPVPRCAVCRGWQRTRTWLFGLGWIAWPFALIWLLVTTGAAPFLLTAAVMTIAQWTLGPHGLLPWQRRRLRDFAPIRDLLHKGWTFGSQPPGVQ